MPDEVLILGCGVAGLTCGVVLAERGRRVRIVAAEHWTQTASGRAGGLWLPYRCEPRDRVLAWSRRTLEVLLSLAGDPGNGVLLRDNLELYRQPTPPEAIWWLSAVPDHRPMASDELPAGYACGFVARVPVMDVPVYMPRLEERFRAAGGRIEVTGQIVRSIADLKRQHPLIVNCTGLGARDLCGDRELIPVRGQLVRTTNPGVDRCVADEHHPLGIAYVIARSTDCILGGTAEENVESLDISVRDRQRLLSVNLSLEPRLKTATVLQDVVCVRPVRSMVRLERECDAAGAVIHNYGHGGAGFTVSWGCAEEVAGLIATIR